MRARRVVGVVAAVVGVAVAALALRTELAVRRAEQEFPRIGEVVEVDGVRLHYVDRGSGSAVVLLHGNPGFVEDYTLGPRNPTDVLAREHRVIVVDRPGHGYSERPSARGTTPAEQARLLHELLARLGVRRPVLVGHSWGGALALVYAERYPSEVRGLVLLGTRAYPSPDAPDRVYALNRVPGLGALARWTVMMPVGQGLLARRLASAYGPDSAHPEHVAAARALWLRPAQVAATVWDTRNMQEALSEAGRGYASLAVPTVIVVGEADRGADESRRLAAELRGARLWVVPGAGHELPLARPDTVVRAVAVAGGGA